MSAAGELNGSVETVRVACSRLPCSASESLPATCSDQSGSRQQQHRVVGSSALDGLPLSMGAEIVAANDLARRAIGSRERAKTDEVLLGAYPLANGARRQRFDCLFSPQAGIAKMVSGVVQDYRDRRRRCPPGVADGTPGRRCGEGCGGRHRAKMHIFKEIFDTASEAMVILQEGRILRANREFIRIFRVPHRGLPRKTADEPDCSRRADA